MKMRTKVGVVVLALVSLIVAGTATAQDWTVELKGLYTESGGAVDSGSSAIGSQPEFGGHFAPAFGGATSFAGNLGYKKFELKVFSVSHFGSVSSLPYSDFSFSSERKMSLSSIELLRKSGGKSWSIFYGLGAVSYSQNRTEFQSENFGEFGSERSSKGTLVGPVVGARVFASVWRASIALSISESVFVGKSNETGVFTPTGNYARSVLSSTFNGNSTVVGSRTSLEAALSFRVVKGVAVGVSGFANIYGGFSQPPMWQLESGSATWEKNKDSFSLYGASGSLIFTF